MKKVVISGTGLFTPEESISNEELIDSFNAYVELFNAKNADAIERGEVTALKTSFPEFIEKASGIKSRYVINKSGILDPERMFPVIADRSDDQQSLQCEMAVKAIEGALAQSGKTAADIDAVLVACSNMQRPYPAMSIEIQHAIGAKGFAFDMNVACSSATFGLQTAADMVRSGSAKCVLMVNPEICSGHLEWRDRDCHFIFGDVCTAVIIETADTCTNPEAWEILGTKLQTQFSNNIRNNFGFLNRCDEEGVGKRDKLFRQEGRKVFKEVCPMVAEQITQHLGELEISATDLKRMWLHQANSNMNDLIARKVLGRDPSPEESPTILDTYANTSSAGSIIAFHLHRNNLNANDIGVICSFGAGYSIGSVIIKKRQSRSNQK
ncbi:beta-ketoacyl-ACP synthase III [uncultured Agitococcus sp.]|uniref:beta-ketoacyl-ACP synthase III n=1 Tax=uncultured Agitococcus sp. TaxID=1506599 RepID=UPI00262FFD92|nr:beta-ketoacyl-ACP synthase III [uncultured Agitococcus sp.]